MSEFLSPDFVVVEHSSLYWKRTLNVYKVYTILLMLLLIHSFFIHSWCPPSIWRNSQWSRWWVCVCVWLLSERNRSEFVTVNCHSAEAHEILFCFFFIHFALQNRFSEFFIRQAKRIVALHCLSQCCQHWKFFKLLCFVLCVYQSIYFVIH